MRSTRRWWHLVADDEDGITLIEVMVAVFILSVALLAMASVGTQSLISLRIARDREHATNAASAAVEAARSRDFGDLALDPSTDPSGLPADVQTLLDISGDCSGGESIVHDAASSDPIPLEQQAGTNDAHDVYTIVTWANEACPATSGELKRVVSLATWRDQGQLRSVRNETLVVEAGRGLPAPNFEVKPAAASLTITPDEAAANVESCIAHQLRNLGATDGYEWRLTDVEGLGSGSTIFLSPSTWWTPNSKWQVRAFFEQPPVDPPRGSSVPTDAETLMADTDANSRPDSGEVVVDPREQATLTVCYRPDDNDAGDFVATIDVLSRFDERRIETVTHRIALQEPGTQFHLQDRDDTQPHPRDDDERDNQESYPPLVMTELTTVNSEDRRQLLAAELRDWSTEIGPTDTSGMRLLRDAEVAALQSVEWRYQFPATRQLLPNGTLTVYVAPDSALAGDTSAFDGTTVKMDLLVELAGLDEKENKNNVIWPSDGPIIVDDSYEHTGTEWAQRVIDLPFDTGREFAPGERLRVRVTCLTTSEENCNIGYDAVSHPANLRVDIQ